MTENGAVNASSNATTYIFHRHDVKVAQRAKMKGKIKAMVHELLKTGRGNAKSSSYIMKCAGIPSRRELYKAVARERRKGYAILSDRHGGYYLADTGTREGRRDLIGNVQRLESMGKKNLIAAADLRRAVSDMIGQEEFDFTEGAAMAAGGEGGECGRP